MTPVTNVETAPAKTPSVMRYDRVQTILDSEPTLKDFLGPKDQEVVKRNKEKHYYSRGVIIVTNALHERGFDAHNAARPTVIRLAVDLLRDKPQKHSIKSVEKPKAPEPKPESPKAEPPKPEPVKAVEVKPKAEPKPKAEAKPKPALKTIAVAKKAVKPEPAPTPVVAIPATLIPTPTIVADQKPGYVYYIYGTALSLAVSLHKTLEIGDRMPGAETRLEAASKLVDLLKPLSNQGVPMPEDFDSALKHDKSTSSSKG